MDALARRARREGTSCGELPGQASSGDESDGKSGAPSGCWAAQHDDTAAELGLALARELSEHRSSLKHDSGECEAHDAACSICSDERAMGRGDATADLGFFLSTCRTDGDERLR